MDNRIQLKNSTKLHVSHFLYRGQEDYEWPLKTTLERNGKNNITLRGYYRLISAVKPQIETFTGINWKVLTYPKFEKWLDKNDSLLPGSLPAYDYMVYLRHHGFPSPLLDWSRSPYVAAFFAFRNAIRAKGKVSIYVYCEYSGNCKAGWSGEPNLCSLGSYVRSHRRHFLQQSEYTVCMARHDEWRFASHEEAYNRNNTQQDLLWKFNIPATERLKILKEIDNYNLNAFSLFSSEESLMETMALRELHFFEKDL